LPPLPFPVTASHAFIVDDRVVGLRVSRIGRDYAYYASVDGTTWQLIRVFHLGDDTTGHQIGFEAQSPTGDGCTVTFDRINFTTQTLTELRDGT
jgi:regulation of enolase protein 1 (concanavalin A-like superfamily)